MLLCPDTLPLYQASRVRSRALCCRGGSVGVGNARAITLPRRPQAARAPSNQRSPLRRGCPPPSRHLRQHLPRLPWLPWHYLGIRLLQPGGVPHRRLVATPRCSRHSVTISSTGILVGTWLGLPTPCRAPPCGCRSWLPVFSLPHFDCLITIYPGIFKAKKH